MSRRMNPKVPTQREKAREIVASIGVYTGQIAKLRAMLGDHLDNSIVEADWKAIESLIGASDAYAEALKSANKALALGRKP